MGNKFLPAITLHYFRLLYYLIRQGNLWKVITFFLTYRFRNHNNRFVSLEKCLPLFNREPPEIKIPVDEPIDIIIPVFNGFEYLEALFHSIFRNTLVPFHLIIIDDNSTDKRIFPFLKKINLENPDTTILIQNNINKGFAESVNLGFQYVHNHFVILNTDIEVPPNWLARLMEPIFSEEDIASTTPFSNAADIFSFPEFPANNPIFEGLDLQTLDSFFRYVHVDDTGIEIPTGVGFCMGVNKRIVDNIGMFDTETFGLGYCEENDWCMRAIEHGFKNILVSNLFVFHKQGGSFHDKGKKKLMRKNYWLLLNRHKNYLPAVYEFVLRDPLKCIRKFLILIITANTGTSKPVLIIGEALGDRRKEDVSPGEKTLRLAYDINRKIMFLQYRYGIYNLEMSVGDLTSIERLLDWLEIKTIVLENEKMFPNTRDLKAFIYRLNKKVIHAT